MLYSSFLTVLLFCSKQIANYLSQGLLIWFNQMIPSLFPTILWSNLLIMSGQAQCVSKYLYKPLHKLFGVTYYGAYALMVGFLCGFPLGAKCISDLYKQKMISKKEAAFLLSFCNLVGPAFVIAFLIPYIGYSNIIAVLSLLFLIPFLYGIILYQVFYRKPFTLMPQARNQVNTKPIWFVLDAAIQNAIHAIVMLGGYIIVFQILRILFVLFPKKMHAFILPILEINYGLQELKEYFYSVPSNHQLLLKYIIICYVSFNGLCCLLQTNHCLENTDLSIKKYFFHKCMITFLTVCFCAVCFCLNLKL